MKKQNVQKKPVNLKDKISAMKKLKSLVEKARKWEEEKQKKLA